METLMLVQYFLVFVVVVAALPGTSLLYQHLFDEETEVSEGKQNFQPALQNSLSMSI
ncbi:MAG: hypothetical protein IPO27_09340 [Bacteroidetes bacterium]|nr:hypothetical protein [Bacteroidota bacterium]